MSYTEQQIWDSQLDSLAEEMLQAGGKLQPPFDAISLARKLNVIVALDSQQTSRARIKQIQEQPAIFIKPDPRPERMQWAAAHELGELAAWKFFKQQILDEIEQESLARYREQLANRFAARILLPQFTFFNDASSCNDDLISLKNIYSTASFELIAMRLLDRSSPMVVTIFDQGKLTRRRSNSSEMSPALHELEKLCWQVTQESLQSISYTNSSMKVQGFPIHQPGWQREIILTSALTEEW